MGLPVDINPLTLGGTGYNINNSLRFRSAVSADLSRTPSVSGNLKTWTWSGWVKRGALGSSFIFGTDYASTGGLHSIQWNSDAIFMYVEPGGGVKTGWNTTSVFRDPSAWYHVIVVFDTTQASVSNMGKIYVNGVLQTTTINNYNATYISQNGNGLVNGTSFHTIGSGRTVYGYYYDGYMAEVNFIDGQALTPSSFGTYNSYGVWAPKKYSGTYGTNGFYLNFNSYGSTAALGTDSSGNGNTWTVNNLSVTAGTTYDPMTDVPTLSSATASNYCVLNPLGKAPTATVTNGNLTLQNSTGVTYPAVGGTVYVSSGKWYWEATYTGSGASEVTVGLSTLNTFISASFSGGAAAAAFWNSAQGIGKNTTYLSATPTFTYGDVVGIAFDADAGTATFYKNGTAQTPTVTGLTAGSYTPSFSVNYYANGIVDANFGQRPFSYTPPTGYNRLNTYNLPAPTIPIGASYMAATTYAGTAATTAFTNTVNGTGLKPDFIWFKDRTVATNHWLINSVTNTWLYSNLTNAEDANSQLNSFDSNGFTLGTNNIALNAAANNYVAWQWASGGATAVTNTNGSISSQVSASQAAGFSVVTFTGTGANATVGHGLGATPAMILIKNRNNVGGTTAGFCVGHVSLPWPNGYLNLWNTNATGSASTVWNTSPTSTVFGVGTDLGTNYSGASYLAYCWAAVAGYSAFGSYTGNGSSDGPFVYLGFRPRWLMVKGTGVTGWYVVDSSRPSYNVITNGLLYPNLSNAEGGGDAFDFLSNGFKVRTSGSDINGSATTVIYAAFAENPFKYALAR